MRTYFLASLAALACSAGALAQNSRVATAREVNGTYRDRSSGSEFRILALGNNRLRVEFDGVYRYKSPRGMTANFGTAAGEATIEGNVAEFVPKDTEGCRITLKFLPGRLVVTQQGADHECGFGQNVSADGTYAKRSGARPKFGAAGK